MTKKRRSRVFDPARYWFYPPVSADIVEYDSDDDVSRIRIRRKKKPVVTFIHGACRDNGNLSSTAAFGVYHGPDSRFNRYGRLPYWASHTSQSAAIWAAQEAVEMTRNHSEDDELFEDSVLIITHSDYLFRNITKNIYTWLKNGFMDAKGGPVVNGKAFRDLHKMVENAEANGITIRFWKVAKGENHDALGSPRAMAQIAFGDGDFWR